MELPEDALLEILYRLPVKSLIRFTCVCKHWHCIITSPQFATKHLATRINSTDSEYDSILAVFTPGCSISIVSYQNLVFETTFKFRPAVVYEKPPPHLNVNHRDIIDRLRVLGPCNGLFLIQLRKGLHEMVFLMWNPATREVFKLPRSYAFECSGFSFDHVVNDYKIVCLNRLYTSKADFMRFAHLYSLATNSWRLLDGDAGLSEIDTAHFAHSFIDTAFSRGMCHWMLLGHSNYARDCCLLLSFDLVDEVFVQTPLPTDILKSHHFHGFLNQGSKHLYPTVCFTDRASDSEGTRGLHVWALEGYGPTGLWNKQWFIRLPQVVNFTLPTADHSLLFWKKKAIIVSGHRDALTWYDFTTRKVRELRIPALGNIVGYTESLVSIAKSVQRRPTADHSLHQEIPSTEIITSVAVEHEEDNQDDSAVETVFQQLLLQEKPAPENHEDDADNSSTDSAFVAPERLGFKYDHVPEINIIEDPGAYYKRYHLRKIEFQKLCKLPYCLREVNQPMISNPCTF